MYMKILKLALVLGVAASPSVAFAQSEIFNGKDFTGWIQRGGKASYAVEGGEIVGTSVTNTPNSFLCTSKSYGDFIFEYEFKVDERLNSGVQIRSEYLDQPTELKWNGNTIKIPAGRVHGYQIEIDPDVKRARMWTAGIYDEARRGWLYPAAGDSVQERVFSAKGQRLFKPNDWNHIRVEARGDSIRTWLNNEPCADIKDGLTRRGFIALQVHEIGRDAGKNGAQVRWRNLKLIEIAKAGATTSSSAGAPPP